MKEMFRGTLMRVTIAVVAVVAILIATVAINFSKKSTGPQPGSGGEVTIIEPDETPLADAPVAENSNETPEENAVAENGDNADASDDASVANATNLGNSNKLASAGNADTANVNAPVSASNPATISAKSTSDDTDSGSDDTDSGSGGTDSGNDANSSNGSNSGNANTQGSGGNSSGSGSSGSGSSGGNNPSVTPSVPDAEMSEAEKYYSESGEIVKIIEADTSPDNLTEAEVEDLLEERGFADCRVTYEYMLGGNYVGTTEIAGAENTIHPIYKALFLSKNSELWSIFVINGEVMANPVSYNLESTRDAQLLVSESKELTSYDDSTNKYFVTIPDESALVVKQIDRIDAETLNGITSGEIDGL